jgi:hypothetical protein
MKYRDKDLKLDQMYIKMDFCVSGSAVAMIGANLRFGSGAPGNYTGNGSRVFQCHPGGETEAILIFSLGALGMAANITLMGLILANKHLRRSYISNIK